MSEAAQIPLTNGGFAIVDAEDAAAVNEHRWFRVSRGRRFYAARNAAGGKTVYMHRAITGAVPSCAVDHVNRNGLDNRRCNLRFCTAQQNMANAGHFKHNTSGYRGVSIDRREGKWRSGIKVEGVRQELGYFDDPIAAAEAYDAAARRLFGEFAFQNFPVVAAGQPDPQKLLTEKIAGRAA